MSLVLVLSSQIVLTALVSTDEVVKSVGISIDTQYIGPIELTPTGISAPLWNYPLFVFIFTLMGNAILIVLLKNKNKTELYSKASS